MTARHQKLCRTSVEIFFETARAAASARPCALEGVALTRNIDSALRVYCYVDASAVMVNDPTAFRVNGMPIAGLRQSGFGVRGVCLHPP